jgi:ribosome assembly protein RRB1
MSKRAADFDEHESEVIKNGDRPMEIDQNDQNGVGEFEDEFEDEFESEDEIMEAGVDGRPDDEREAEERESRLSNPGFYHAHANHEQ